MIDQLNAGIKTAMKAKDKVRLTTLRGIKSEADKIAKKEVRDTLSADIEKAILTGIKQRREAVTMYDDGGREDLVDKELLEISILEEFLPDQLTDEEISEIVDDVIATVNASSMKDMGKVMGFVNGKIPKGSADGAVVAKIVKAKLNS